MAMFTKRSSSRTKGHAVVPKGRRLAQSGKHSSAPTLDGSLMRFASRKHLNQVDVRPAASSNAVCENCVRAVAAKVNTHQYAIVINTITGLLLLAPDVYRLANIGDDFLPLYFFIMSVCWIPLLVDVIIFCVIAPKYLGGLIFWMDLVGAAAFVLELPIFPCPEFAVCGAAPLSMIVVWRAVEGQLAWTVRMWRLLRFLRFLRLLRFQRGFRYKEHVLTQRLFNLRSFARVLAQGATLVFILIVGTLQWAIELNGNPHHEARASASWLSLIGAQLTTFNESWTQGFGDAVWLTFHSFAKGSTGVPISVSCIEKEGELFGAVNHNWTWWNPFYGSDATGPAQGWNRHVFSQTVPVLGGSGAAPSSISEIVLEVDETMFTQLYAATNLAITAMLLSGTVMFTMFQYDRVSAMVMAPVSGVLALVEAAMPGIFGDTRSESQSGDGGGESLAVQTLGQVVSWNKAWALVQQDQAAELFGIIDRVENYAESMFEKAADGADEVPQGIDDAEEEVQAFICNEFTARRQGELDDETIWNSFAAAVASQRNQASTASLGSASSASSRSKLLLESSRRLLNEPSSEALRRSGVRLKAPKPPTATQLPHSFGGLTFVPFEFSKEKLADFAFSFLRREKFATEGGVDSSVLRCLVDAVADGYFDIAYHSFHHAVDVMQTLAYFLKLVTNDDGGHKFSEHSDSFSRPGHRSLRTRQAIGLSDDEARLDMSFGLHAKPLSADVRFVTLIAALGHDVGHPGVNNHYLVRTADPVALTYNDVSVLENMHAATLLQIIQGSRRNLAFPKEPITRGHPRSFTGGLSAQELDADAAAAAAASLEQRNRCNVFARLKPAHVKKLRAVIVKGILGTDMAKHFGHLSALQSFYATHEKLLTRRQNSLQRSSSNQSVSNGMRSQHSSSHHSSGNSEDFMGAVQEDISKLHLVPLMLHAADISNVVKPFDVAMQHSTRVMEEFYAQGDLERSKGFDVQLMYVCCVTPCLCLVAASSSAIPQPQFHCGCLGSTGRRIPFQNARWDSSTLS